MMRGIIQEKFQGWSVEPLKKGWSRDEKYLLKRNGEIRTLRLSKDHPVSHQKKEFESIGAIPLEKGIIRPLHYGELMEGVSYILYTYEEGDDLRPVLPDLTEVLQYDLGLQAGKILSAIHSVKDPEGDVKDFEAAYLLKIETKIGKCLKHQVSFPGLQEAIGYIRSHQDLLKGRPSVLQHGDYHIGNMIVEGNVLKVLDFNRFGFGDPFEEFDRMSMNIHYSRAFSKGLLHAYFQGTPPTEFFAIWKLYALTNAVGSIPWALENSPDSLSFVEEMVQHTFREFLVDESPVPRWYRTVSDITYERTHRRRNL